MKPICVICIATGPKYLELWQELAHQLISRSSRPDVTRLILLTDDVATAQFEATLLTDRFPCAIEVHSCPPYRWPDATLFRYELLLPALGHVEEPIVVYLDVDMACNQGWDDDVRRQVEDSGDVCLVPHPGFPPVGSAAWWRMIVSRRGLLRESARTLVRGRTRTMGSWETSPDSAARVEVGYRARYLHGAVWFGPTRQVTAMVAELASRVRRDLDAGIIAVWHDESHLNWFGAYRQVSVADTRFSSVIGWSALRREPWVFSSIEKDFRRD